MDSTMQQPMDAAPVGGSSFDTNIGKEPQQPDASQEFEADFDAGVDANEEDNPKKFIQQLTGKLSQSLRKYNEELPQPDAELSKYVAGMIIKQAVDGLSQQDVADIMDKVENDGAEEDMEQGTQQPEAQPMDAEKQPMEPEQPIEPINETTGSTVDATETKQQRKSKKMKKSGYNRKPYIATI